MGSKHDGFLKAHTDPLRLCVGRLSRGCQHWAAQQLELQVRVPGWPGDEQPQPRVRPRQPVQAVQLPVPVRRSPPGGSTTSTSTQGSSPDRFSPTWWPAPPSSPSTDRLNCHHINILKFVLISYVKKSFNK